MTASKKVKVKLFGSDSNVTRADNTISDWMKNNPNCEIKDVKITGAGSDSTHYMIAITYLE